MTTKPPIAHPSPAACRAAPEALTLEQALMPYTGPSIAGVDVSTLSGKVMCGYQGWFAHQDDGYGIRNHHWGDVCGDQPTCTVDMWPDIAEFSPEELFPTNFRHADGTVARVFSSTTRATVLRHFAWMQAYGIDGVFVQRFAGPLLEEQHLRASTAVLGHCREGANRHGRSFAVMYDMTFTSHIEIVKRDWQRLFREMRITDSPAYQRHDGHPVVSLWGYGVERPIDPAASAELFRFFKRPENGACTIMLGVDNDWRGLPAERGGAELELVDIVSPWNVGRYASPEAARAHFATYWPGDLAWCRARGKAYYPVVFPGFSWRNLLRTRGQDRPLDQIPRRGGEFFWSQIEEVKRYGLDMAYVAMFDEVDEATAIFKVTSHPPVGDFVTYGDLPSDHYLRLAGAAARLLSGREDDPAAALRSAFNPCG